MKEKLFCKKCKVVELDKYNYALLNNTKPQKHPILCCKGCHSLYCYYDNEFMLYMGDENTLIANIDSPKNNSIKCECGSLACKANLPSRTKDAYWCPDCHKLYFIKH